MQRFIITVIVLMVSNVTVYSQRLLKGQKGFEVTTGLLLNEKKISRNFYFQAAMTINAKNGNYQLWSGEYSRQTKEFENNAIPVETYMGEGGYSFALLGDRAKNISLNLGITAVAGYEIINGSESVLASGAVIGAKDGFIYGAAGRLSLEAYLYDHLVLLVQGRTKVLWGTSTDQFRPSAGLGLRYIF